MSLTPDSLQRQVHDDTVYTTDEEEAEESSNQRHLKDNKLGDHLPSASTSLRENDKHSPEEFKIVVQGDSCRSSHPAVEHRETCDFSDDHFEKVTSGSYFVTEMSDSGYECRYNDDNTETAVERRSTESEIADLPEQSLHSNSVKPKYVFAAEVSHPSVKMVVETTQTSSRLVSEHQTGAVSSSDFEVRRERYRYIKCWEDKRVQMLGILSSMIEEMSKHSIEIANSSTLSNARVIKYFSDKAAAWLKYSEMKLASIGKSSDNKESFGKLNEVLDAVSKLTQHRMQSARLLADFVQTDIVNKSLTSEADKYQERIAAYKDYVSVVNKRIQRIGHHMAEEYREYSNLFSDLARLDIKASGSSSKKRSLQKELTRKDLCYSEWVFLSEVFQHFELVKCFGVETLAFIHDLRGLEISRVSALKNQLKGYLNLHETLISKISYSQSPSHSPRKHHQPQQIMHPGSFIKKQSSLILQECQQQSPSKMLRSKHNRQQSPIGSQMSSFSQSQYRRHSTEMIEMSTILTHRPSNQIQQPTSRGQYNENTMGQSQTISELDISVISVETLKCEDIISGLEYNSVGREVQGFFTTEALISQEEQLYLKKINELQEDCEVQMEVLEKFILQFQLLDIKQSPLIFRQYHVKLALDKKNQSKKQQQLTGTSTLQDAFVIITLDKNLIIVESLASNQVKKPIHFIKGYRLKTTAVNMKLTSQEGENSASNLVQITEITNILFRTTNKYLIAFDNHLSLKDFLSVLDQR